MDLADPTQESCCGATGYDEAMGKDVSTPGDKLVASILADLEAQGLRPDAREVALLARARHAVNQIADLELVLVVNGSTYLDKDGLARPSPVLNEIRQQTSVLARVLSGVQMVAPAEAKSLAHQRAGAASWNARIARAQQREQAG